MFVNIAYQISAIIWLLLMIFVSKFQAFCVGAGYQLNEHNMMRFEKAEYQLHAYLLVHVR